MASTVSSNRRWLAVISANFSSSDWIRSCAARNVWGFPFEQWGLWLRGSHDNGLLWLDLRQKTPADAQGTEQRPKRAGRTLNGRGRG